MPEYSFTTVWRIEAPLDAVWEAISASKDWPIWWRAVEAVHELRKGGEDGIGNVRRYTFKGKLPYRLSFDLEVTEVDRPRALGGLASGELTGTGRWTFAYEDPVTTVRYDWNVRTTRWWMNLVAPLARPIFETNHDYVMARGIEGLGRLLGARVLDGSTGHGAR